MDLSSISQSPITVGALGGIVVHMLTVITNFIIQRRKVTLNDDASFRTQLMKERNELVDEIDELRTQLHTQEQNVHDMRNEILKAKRECIECTQSHLAEKDILERRIWFLESETHRLEHELRDIKLAHKNKLEGSE